MTQIAILPSLEVDIGGIAIELEEASHISSLFVSQRLSLPTQAEVTFCDPPESLFQKIESNAEVSLQISIAESLVFTGIITAVEFISHPSLGETIRVRGYDNLYKLRKQQQIRTHSDVSCVDIIKEITGELGINIDTKETAPLWPWIIQFQQSDLDFMKSIAQRAGLYFILNGNRLELISLYGNGNKKTLVKGKNLLEVAIGFNGDRNYSSIVASGWNPFTVNRHEGKATESRTVNNTKNRNIDGLASDAKVLKITNATFYNDRHAETLSQAVLDQSMANGITLNGVAEGDPDLRPGVEVKVEGIHSRAEGSYVLTSVIHHVDSQMGYISKISSIPPEPECIEQGPIALLGEVISVQDPDNLGRVKVSLTTCENVETQWLSVMMPAAGADKGIVALPDVGDKVIILLINNDPSFGIVLGGLYGTDKQSPGWGVTEGAVKEFRFATRGGQLVLLDDKNRRIRIENKEGSFCNIGPGKVTLHSKGDLILEAPGKKVKIRGRNIDFERA
jgi:phage protein D/phage baseplate assembly protein gpV